MSGAKAAGILMGSYHFAQPGSNTPTAEANYYWSVAGSTILADGKSITPMLDMEVFNGVVGASSYSDWANQWCNAIVAKAAAAGVTLKPMIYVSACSACNFNSSAAQWTPDIANYNGQNPQTGTPWSACSSCNIWGSGNWSVWQYTSTGSVSGISGNVDRDVFNGTWTDLVNTLGVQTLGTKNTFTSAQVTASAYTTPNGLPSFAVDGTISQTQYWAAQGSGQWIKFDMGSSKTLGLVKIAWYAGNARRETFTVQVSNDDVNYFNVLTNVQSSGATLGLETWDFTDVNARYIKVIGYGNTASDWNSMTEFEAWTVATAGRMRMTGSQATASIWTTPNGLPSFAVDGTISSTQYWAGNGSGAWIQFDMGATKTLDFVKIAWAAGDARRETFSLDVSTDGTTWTNVLNHVQTSGTTLGFEKWDFTNVSARYIKVTGYGNTVNTWNSITEFEPWIL